MSKIDVYVASHKNCRFALPDYCKWIQVNSLKNGSWDDFLHDCDGENISDKNNSYCELTALFSLWKNSTADIKGLFHYRRFIGNDDKLCLKYEINSSYGKEIISKKIISESQIISTLNDYDVILTRPDCPYPLTAYDDLLRFVYHKDVWVMIDTIEELYPEYSDSLWHILKSKNISYCNMFIAGKDFTDKYCTWLFDILFSIEKKIDISDYDTSHQRIFGYYAELLLCVYIHKHNLKCKYMNMVKLDETDKPTTKSTVKYYLNNVLRLFNIYPRRVNRSLWKARYDYMKTNILPTIDKKTDTSEAITKYMTECGGRDVTRHIISGKDFSCIKGRYGSINLYMYICDDINKLNDIIADSKKYKEQTVNFGFANIVKIICSDNSVLNSEKEILRNGIDEIIIFYDCPEPTT